MARYRIALFLLLATSSVLVWALPSTAHETTLKATTVTVTAGKPSEFSFKLSTKTVPAGTVTFVVTNSGALPHDFSIGGKTTKLITPKSSTKLTVKLKAGKAPYQCTVSGHAAAGMKGVLTVK